MPLMPISPMMIIGGTVNRPGLSQTMVASRVISRQKEIDPNIPIGNLMDGSPNLMNKLIAIIVEEVYNAMRLEGKVEIAIPPNAIVSTGVGANAGGPVTVTSTNTLPISASGIIR